jgi:hypothetical protein
MGVRSRSPCICQHPRILPTVDCPPFSLADQVISLAHGIELETLIACCDRSYDPTSQRGSHGWLFANDGQDPVFQGAGLDDCHSQRISSNRSELGGLIIVLYVIYSICLYHEITSKNLTTSHPNTSGCQVGIGAL